MKKILVGGTFNIIHPGHVFLLEKARSLGDYLIVVLASDATVRKNKAYLVPARFRKVMLESLRMVDRVVLGDDRDFFRVIEKEKPDVIVLGPDQEMPGLESFLKRKDINLVRIRESLPGFKTSRLLNQIKGSLNKI